MIRIAASSLFPIFFLIKGRLDSVNALPCSVQDSLPSSAFSNNRIITISRKKASVLKCIYASVPVDL
jgi:hypothetical protein